MRHNYEWCNSGFKYGVVHSVIMISGKMESG